MQVPVLVEQISTHIFRAKAWDLVAEGPSADDAVLALHQMLRGGKSIAMLDLPLTNPFLAIAGDLKDDPLVDGWVAAMRTYREEKEADPNY
ncbi:hypothetical protein [Armatimonas sp.]|uniref:hypothetical protein n=1 Tax=Armatimonas sp. TaxID=1872638 RepID=UPI00286B88E9|nr:hypothetical protein [Armatimonas sp.]